LEFFKNVFDKNLIRLIDQVLVKDPKNILALLTKINTHSQIITISF